MGCGSPLRVDIQCPHNGSQSFSLKGKTDRNSLWSHSYFNLKKKSLCCNLECKAELFREDCIKMEKEERSVCAKFGLLNS